MNRKAIVLAAIAGVLAASLSPALGQSTWARWSTLAPMPTARQEISVSVLDGKVFAIAGYDANGQSTATVEVYDPRTNAWQKAAPLPIATNHNVAATVNGRLYASGGTSSRAFVYDAGRDAWTEVASMGHSHGGTPAVAVIGGKIYVAGGTGPDMVGHELEVYDPVADKWQVLAPMAVPRNHTAGGAIGGRFYVVGGRGSPNASTAHEAYDPTTNTWTTRAQLPPGRSGIAAGVVGDRLYLFGGENPSALQRGRSLRPGHRSMAGAPTHARSTPRYLRRRDREHDLPPRWRCPARPGRNQGELGFPRESLTGASVCRSALSDALRRRC